MQLVFEIATALGIGWLGRRWPRRGHTPPPMFTFVGGATFAAAMAIVRFAWIERAR